MTKQIKLFLYITLGLSVFTGGYFTGKQDKPKTEIKEVVKFKERVRTRTVIKERPDGTKETTIVEDRNTQSNSKKLTQIGRSDWSVGVSSTLKSEPIYGLRIERRMLADFWLGGYATTDKEFGVSLRYDF